MQKLNFFFAIFVFALPGGVIASTDLDVVAIAYHDVRDNIERDSDMDQYAVSTANLAAHFNWLRSHGYTVVGLEEIIAARRGERNLPAKAVLLSFKLAR